MIEDPVQTRLRACVRRLPEPVCLRSGEWRHDWLEVTCVATDRFLVATMSERWAALCSADHIETLDEAGETLVSAIEGEWKAVRNSSGILRRPSVAREDREASPSRYSTLYVQGVSVTGGRLREALRKGTRSGRGPVGALALIDRGVIAPRRVASGGVRLHTIFTYRHLGVRPTRGPFTPLDYLETGGKVFFDPREH